MEVHSRDARTGWRLITCEAGLQAALLAPLRRLLLVHSLHRAKCTSAPQLEPCRWLTKSSVVTAKCCWLSCLAEKMVLWDEQKVR